MKITRQDVLAHQNIAPWPQPAQVEQDLLLSLAMAAIFRDEFLRQHLAMRGGTVLHKVHLAPPARYSEDIDLVLVSDVPPDSLGKSIRSTLMDILGKPRKSVWEDAVLTVRNWTQASKILRLTFAVPSVTVPGRDLLIKVEINISENRPFRPPVEREFTSTFRGESRQESVMSFDFEEMLGTKLRALFQRRQGRDLFDLYWALFGPSRPPSETGQIIAAFRHYMRQEGASVTREDFVSELDSRLSDAGFCSDMEALLRSDLTYDPQLAGRMVKSGLLVNL